MHTDSINLLKRRDKKLRTIIDRVGHCKIKPLPPRHYFTALCQAIVSQQLSSKAAETIFRRFKELFDRKIPTATAVLKLTDEQLRGVGISPQKMRYIRDLAEKFEGGHVPTRKLSKMSDDEVIAALIQVKGLGVWTVQMFLIFVLNRPDVLPVDDLGIRKAAQKHFDLKDLPKAEELTSLTEHWRPYRSIASWYMWQSLANAPMEKKVKSKVRKAK